MTDLLPIIFSKGQNEGTDPRVLPVNEHKAVKNVRFRKDGRPQKRPGITQVLTTGVSRPLLNAICELSGSPFVLAGGQPNVFSAATASWLPLTGSGNLGLSNWAPGTQKQDFLLESNVLTRPTSAVFGSFNVVAEQLVGLAIGYRVTGPKGELITPGASVSGTAYPRLLATTNFLYLFTMDANPGAASANVKVAVFNTVSGGFGAQVATVAAMANAGAGGVLGFDVVARGTEFIITFQSLATTITIARWSAVAIPTLTTSKVVTITSATIQPSVAVTATSSIWAAWATTAGVGQFLAFDSTLTTQTGAIATVSGTGNTDQPGILPLSNTTAQLFFGKSVLGIGSFTVYSCDNIGTAATTVTTITGVRMMSKPFVGPAFATLGAQDSSYVWCHTNDSVGWDDQRASFLVRVSPSLNANIAAPQLYVGTAPGAETQVAGVSAAVDHLNEVVVRSDGSYAMTMKVQRRGFVNTSLVQLFSIETITAFSIYSTQFAAAVDTVQAGKALQISGGVLSEMNGIGVETTGFMHAPVISAIAVSSGAGLTFSSNYLYKACVEYIDGSGRRQRSATSDPFAVSTGAATGIAQLSFLFPSLVGTQNQASLHVYRSLAGQSTYHRVTPNVGAPAFSAVTYFDSMTDAVASTQEFIYTDGGVLDHTPPPSSTFMCICNGRVWLGGQFYRNVITASKLLVDGEPTQFSNLASFNVVLPEDCTGLTSIDGTVVAFSKNNVYLVTGDGPNNQGTGSFSPPALLPADTGCIDWRSVCACSLGVFFQSLRGIYLMPRGFNTPQFVGGPVQDTLLANPTITSATLVVGSDSNEISVRFTCTNGSSTSAVLVYDIRTGGWIIDQTPNALQLGPGGTYQGLWAQAKVNSDQTLNSIWQETPGTYADTATFISSSLSTGDVRPFGTAGYGMFKGVVVMGEYRGNSIVNVAVSVDGITADTVAFNVTSADAADGVVYLDATPRVQKGASIQVTVSDAPIGGVATEGFIAQAVFVETETIGGTKRLPVGRRA